MPCVDSTILCKLSDCCIQVVRQGKTKQEDVLAAFEQLKTYGVNVIGSVLTFSKGTEYKDYSAYSYR